MNVLLQPISRFFLSVLCIFFSSGQLSAASLNGTVSFVYKNDHHVFSDGDIAQGFVRMGGGFTIKPGAKATLDTVISVSGAIDLRETGVMQLVKGLQLDSGVTWSSGGYINGRGNLIQFNNSLVVPSSKIIHVVSDLVIDGGGGILSLGDYSKIVIDNNATLTLRNMNIKNKKNTFPDPCLKIQGSKGKLALDNVRVAMSDDINIIMGELYIHNDVTFTGTSALVYTSASPLRVAPFGTLTFDLGTTFSFAPVTTDEELFVLQDRTSTLCLNGCTLQATNTGMRITKGTFALKNKVTLDNNRGGSLTVSTLSALTSRDYGTAGAARIHYLEWHPSGRYLAVCGDSPAAVGGFADTNEIRIYSFDGTTLTALTSQDYGTGVNALAWHPSGDVLAVGGIGPVSGAGGFANNHELRLYRFDGSTLTALTSQDYGTSGGAECYGISWNNAGSVLAVGGIVPAAVGGFTATDDLRLYGFNGSALTPIVGSRFGFLIYDIAWHPNDTVIAIGGESPVSGGGFANTDELRLYTFNGSTLTPLTSRNYGHHVHHMVWNKAGTILAIGGEAAVSDLSGSGFANTDELRIYSFDGSTLSPITSAKFGVDVDSVEFHPTEQFIIVGGESAASGGGFANTHELRLYGFNGTSLSALASREYGTQIYASAWNPDGTVIACGGQSPANNLSESGFANTDELRLYTTDYSLVPTPPSNSQAIIFGKSSAGSSYDLNVEVLGGAHVIIDGKIVDDSA